MSAHTDRTALLHAAAVTVRMSGRTLVDAVTIDLHCGEVLALVGPNGAGKSTLLGVLAGDVHPDAGEVTMLGASVSSLRPAQLARLRAVLLQSNDVSFSFTVGEIVEMGRMPWRGHPAEEQDAACIADALRDADVTHLAERRVPDLSGGERARAALARVLAQSTPVLVLDEPTAALDIRHQEAVLRRARTHADAGGGVVVVLHDLELAAAYADRIAVLQEGSLVACGAPDQVLTGDLLSRVYGHPIRVEQASGGRLAVVPERLAAEPPRRELSRALTAVLKGIPA